MFQDERIDEEDEDCVPEDRQEQENIDPSTSSRKSARSKKVPSRFFELSSEEEIVGVKVAANRKDLTNMMDVESLTRRKPQSKSQGGKKSSG